MNAVKIIDEINNYCNGYCARGGAVRPVRRQQLAEQQRRENLTEGELRREQEAELGNVDKLYDALLDEAEFEPNDVNRTLLKKKLNVKPIKDEWRIFSNGWLWQADTKVFGQDVYGGDEVVEATALLVCVDASTRRCDAQPVNNVAQLNCIPAMTTILNRHIIQQGYPKIMYTDQGGEFGQNFTKYIKDNFGIKHKYSYAGRKQQTSIVEHTIGLISFGLMANLYKMRVEGKRPNQRPRHIIEVNILANNILPRLINKINKWASQHFPKPAKNWFKFEDNIQPTDLKVGDWVLVPNLKPKRIKNRSGQHNYLKTPYQIIKIFRPVLKGEPYRFLTNLSLNNSGQIDKKKIITFKRDELQKVDNNNVIGPVIEFD